MTDPRDTPAFGINAPQVPSHTERLVGQRDRAVVLAQDAVDLIAQIIAQSFSVVSRTTLPPGEYAQLTHSLAVFRARLNEIRLATDQDAGRDEVVIAQRYAAVAIAEEAIEVVTRVVLSSRSKGSGVVLDPSEFAQMRIDLTTISARLALSSIGWKRHRGVEAPGTADDTPRSPRL